PGIFDFKGSTYTTGFTNELWFSIQGGRTTRYERRSASLAKLSFDADGTIPKIPWFGVGNPVPGVSQVGSLNPYDTVQAETICFSKGVRTEACKDVSGKMNVDSIHNGDYIKVKGVDFNNSGSKLFEARVASGANGGTIELYLDSLTGTKIGSCTFQGTNGWQSWVTKSCAVSDVSGKHDLFLKFTGGNGLLFNFNWWKFTGSTGSGITSSNSLYCNKVKLSVDKASYTVNIDFLHVTSHQNVHVELYDANGRLMRSIRNNAINTDRISLHLNKNKIHAGIYLIRVLQNNKTVLTQQFNLQ
ncbi:MAG TPA: carbohydrate-binding protein, partial [Chitinispirillaceae bacterium]|nr:carbohydrate-binding protein [Chitinispirillaceae bacterium]